MEILHPFEVFIVSDLVSCSLSTFEFGETIFVDFLAKFDETLMSKKVAELNRCRISLTFETPLIHGGLRRARWLHVLPQK